MLCCYKKVSFKSTTGFLKSFNILSVTIFVVLTKTVLVSFMRLYGISWKNLIVFFYKCGVAVDCTYKQLMSNHLILFQNILHKYGSNKNIQVNRENMYLKRFFCFINFKSIRMFKGLPINGQRTRSNAMSCRSIVYHKRVLSIIRELKIKF